MGVLFKQVPVGPFSELDEFPVQPLISDHFFFASMWWDTVVCQWRFTELKRMQETSGLHETFAWCSAHPALHFQSHACRRQPEQNVEFWNPRNSVDTCVLCVGYLHSLSFTHYPQVWLSGLVQIHYTKNWSEFHVRRQSWHLGPRNMKTPRQANIDFVVAQPPNRRSKSSLNLGQKRKENSYPPIPSLKLTGCTWKIGRKPPKGKDCSEHQFSGGLGKSFREGTTSDSQNAKTRCSLWKSSLSE